MADSSDGLVWVSVDEVELYPVFVAHRDEWPPDWIEAVEAEEVDAPETFGYHRIPASVMERYEAAGGEMEAARQAIRDAIAIVRTADEERAS